MKKMYLLSVLTVSVCLIVFLTSCSDSSSNNNPYITGNTLPPETLTPIETGNIDTYEGTYSGVEIMKNNTTIMLDWDVLIFKAKATLEKVDDGTLKLKYNFQYDGYTAGHYTDIEGYDIDIKTIGIVEKDENIIQVSVRNQDRDLSTFSIKKEKDRIEEIDESELIVKNDLCNAASGASSETSCSTPSGAQTLIGSYKIAELAIDCGNGMQTTGGGFDIFGEVTAAAIYNSQSKVDIPVYIKLQVDSNSNALSGCDIGDGYFYKKINFSLENIANPDLIGIFNNIGFELNRTAYSPDTVSYTPKENINNQYEDILIFDKKVTMKLQLMESGKIAIDEENSSVKKPEDKRYW